MDKKYENLQIDDVCFVANSDGGGQMIISWSGSEGWGEFKLGFFTNEGETNKIFYIDDECMDKEFCMALLEKLYDKCEGEK